jgi:predicted dehydrogenase
LTTSDLEITTDDYTSCLFEFDNGIMGELHLDLLQPEESRYVKVIGSKGVLIADITKNYVKYNTVENIEWVNENIAVDFDKIYEEEDNNAIDFIKGKPSITTSIVEGAKVMQVIEAIRRSSSIGTRIRLPIYD